MIDIKYLFSKFLLYIQIPAIKNAILERNVKIGHKSNILNSKIGRYTYCGNNCTINNTEIGSFCSIASYCSIGGEGHPINFASTSPVFYQSGNVFNKNLGTRFLVENRRTIIGNDVWIGEKAFIKDGVIIGDGAIIGANSVVTHDVLPYSIVGGCPARLIKYRFNDEIISQLLEIEWWKFDDDKLTTIFRYNNDIEEFIKICKESK